MVERRRRSVFAPSSLRRSTDSPCRRRRLLASSPGHSVPALLDPPDAELTCALEPGGVEAYLLTSITVAISAAIRESSDFAGNIWQPALVTMYVTVTMSSSWAVLAAAFCRVVGGGGGRVKKREINSDSDVMCGAWACARLAETSPTYWPTDY